MNDLPRIKPHFSTRSARARVANSSTFRAPDRLLSGSGMVPAFHLCVCIAFACLMIARTGRNTTRQPDVGRSYACGVAMHSEVENVFVEDTFLDVRFPRLSHVLPIPFQCPFRSVASLILVR
ncbi:unnamed protein product, partial [Ectocarpus sp. 8 AP-2014]